MKLTRIKKLVLAVSTVSLCLIAAPQTATAANSFCLRNDFAVSHNGHYDTWHFIAHGTELPYNHWHSWTNLTHNGSNHRENYCPEYQ